LSGRFKNYFEEVATSLPTKDLKKLFSDEKKKARTLAAKEEQSSQQLKVLQQQLAQVAGPK
jgi:hypothetical protein